jgi:hypothetical protein
MGKARRVGKHKSKYNGQNSTSSRNITLVFASDNHSCHLGYHLENDRDVEIRKKQSSYLVYMHRHNQYGRYLTDCLHFIAQE